MMPKYRVTGPDGQTYDITAPEGASEQEIMDYVRTQVQGRGTRPGTPAQAAPTSSPEAEPQRAPPAARTMMGLGRELQAAMQGTSPFTETMGGEAIREPLGRLIESDAGPGFMGSGGFQSIDPSKHVILTDPNTGQTAVYPRTEKTEERFLSAARLLGLGAIAPSNIRVPGGVSPSPSRAAALARDFEATGVDPSLPAVTQSRSAGVAAQALRNTPGASAPIQAGTERQVGQAAAAAERAARARGLPGSADDIGVALQKGVERFNEAPRVAIPDPDVIKLPTRATSISQKADALYNRVGRRIPNQQRFNIDEGMRALGGAAERFDNPGLAKAFTDPELAKWKTIVEESDGILSWNDIKQFRTEVGKLIRKPVLHTDIDRAQLERLYSGLTRDLEAAALEAGGEGALRAFKRADTFYNKALTRLDTNLKRFFSTTTPEQAYERALRAAQAKGGDVRSLAALKKSVDDDIWGDFVATAIDRMGRSTPGAADVLSVENFSPATFITNYSKLGEKAKDVLFSGPGLAETRKAWDSLIRTTGALKNVERLRNVSNTGGNVISAGILISAGVDPISTILGLVSARGMGGLLMSPKFTRWLVQADKIRGPRAMAAHMARLRALGASDQKFGPELLELSRDLRSALAEPESQTQEK